LPFNAFVTGRRYNYGYDYASDPIITAANDPNINEIIKEWSKYKFFIKTYQYSSDPVLWRIAVTVYYKKKGGGEENIQLVTIR